MTTGIFTGEASLAGPRRRLASVVAVAGAPLVAVGIGRFAYGLVLPQMRADLGWSYTVAGFATTINALGYLVGALSAAPIASRIGIRRACVLGWALTAVAVGATGVWRTTPTVLAARGVAGLASGVTFVAGASLAAHLASQLRIRPGISLGLYAAGAGAGIVCSGIVASLALAIPGHRGWQLMWITLGVASLLSLWVVRRPLMRVREPLRTESAMEGSTHRPGSVRNIGRTLIGYFLFGLGYITYMTFVVAYLRGVHAGSSLITAFWILLGLAAVLGSVAWGTILDRFRGGAGPSLVLAVTLVGAVLPVISASNVVAVISGLIFGSSFLATATAVTILVRRILAPGAWTWAIGMLTAAFGVGQTIGPSITGAIADGPGGTRAGLAVSCGFLCLGVAVLALQREQNEPSPGLVRARVSTDEQD